jgi:hypothetical protein
MKWVILISLVMTIACTKKLPTYSRQEMYSLVKEGDPSVFVYISEDKKINCYDYKPACNLGFTAKVRGLDMIFLQYDEVEDAKKAAAWLGSYYVRNWVLDDVKGEPILEKFATEHLSATLVP